MMHGRYSDRARKVMSSANQEAIRFNHEYVGTEHVLLALIKEGEGIATRVLRCLGVRLQHLRLEIEKRMQSGPDMVTLGRLPHSPRLKQMQVFALEEAELDQRADVDTADLLLALLRDGESTAAQVLRSLNITLEKVRLAVKAAEERTVRCSEDVGIPLRRISVKKSPEQQEAERMEDEMLNEFLNRHNLSRFNATTVKMLLQQLNEAFMQKNVPARALELLLVSRDILAGTDLGKWNDTLSSIADQASRTFEAYQAFRNIPEPEEPE